MPTYRVTWTKPGERPRDAGPPIEIEAPDQATAIAAAKKRVTDPEFWVWSAECVPADI